MTKTKQHASDHTHWTSRTTSISEQLEYLENHIAEDWHDGWQAQCYMMCVIAGDISDWLNQLFKIAIDRGVKLAKVQECLEFMEESIMQMINNRCRTKYDDCTDANTHQITNSEGNVCYEGPPEWVIPRFRRDLLIMAIIQKDAAVIEAFTAYRHECQELLEVTHDPDDPQRIEDEYGMGFQDEWHTIAMKAALPELRAILM